MPVACTRFKDGGNKKPELGPMERFYYCARKGNRSHGIVILSQFGKYRGAEKYNEQNNSIDIHEKDITKLGYNNNTR